MSEDKQRDPDGPFEPGEGDGDVRTAATVAPEPPRRRISPKSPRQAIQPEKAPPMPPRSKRVRHPLVVALNFFIMVAVIGMVAVGAGLYFGKSRFVAQGPLGESKTVMIPRGTDLESIASLLKRQQVIDSDFIFSNGVRLYKQESRLKAGEYLFEPGVSMREVMDALVSGRSILHAFTVPEGVTSQQVVDRLLANDVLVGEVAEVPPEGALLPDTYKFTRGTSRQQILDQMKRAQQKAVEEIWARRSPDVPIDNVEDFVTLASIVEKETGRADERPRVAAVFINRLKKNMRLQSDPTIIYGMFGGKGKPPDRPIMRSDINRETPYNTYTIAGLPPTPIANPGRESLEAVANPSRTDELYFVADGTGGHVFATSLDEHNRNVARWRKIEQARQEAVKAAGGTAAATDASLEGVEAEPPPAARP
ncbi:endolytic transglycosylase MltG [Faunimonas sp. B44]|uniref:endolytic transglycosylase MltG n=1 Tax=Faunimonas sp. B44 TaxID=3461493 RepID=UPI004044D254